MSDTPWLSVDEGILRHREFAMLEWVPCVKPNPPQRGDLEDMLFVNPIRCKITGRGAPAYLKSFIVILFLVLDLRVEDSAGHLYKLIHWV